MDPVKEKLNLLKKIASEKRKSKVDLINSNNNNNKQNEEPFNDENQAIKTTVAVAADKVLYEQQEQEQEQSNIQEKDVSVIDKNSDITENALIINNNQTITENNSIGINKSIRRLLNNYENNILNGSIENINNTTTAAVVPEIATTTPKSIALSASNNLNEHHTNGNVNGGNTRLSQINKLKELFTQQQEELLNKKQRYQKSKTTDLSNLVQTLTDDCNSINIIEREDYSSPSIDSDTKVIVNPIDLEDMRRQTSILHVPVNLRENVIPVIGSPVHNLYDDLSVQKHIKRFSVVHEASAPPQLLQPLTLIDNKNRSRFLKKKEAPRSHSVELEPGRFSSTLEIPSSVSNEPEQLVIAGAAVQNKPMPKSILKNSPTHTSTPPPQQQQKQQISIGSSCSSSILPRPSLTRQNAIAKSYDSDLHNLHLKNFQKVSDYMYRNNSTTASSSSSHSSSESSSSTSSSSSSSTTSSSEESFKNTSKRKKDQHCEKCCRHSKKHQHHHKHHHHHNSKTKHSSKDKDKTKTKKDKLKKLNLPTNPQLSPLAEYQNYSSDDSVCGIPKSTIKLCSSKKPFYKSMDDLEYGFGVNYKDNIYQPEISYLTRPKSHYETNQNKQTDNGNNLNDTNLYKSKSFVWDSSFNTLNTKDKDKNKEKSKQPKQPKQNQNETGYPFAAVNNNENTFKPLNPSKNQQSVLGIQKKLLEQTTVESPIPFQVKQKPTEPYSLLRNTASYYNNYKPIEPLNLHSQVDPYHNTSLKILPLYPPNIPTTAPLQASTLPIKSNNLLDVNAINLSDSISSSDPYAVNNGGSSIKNTNTNSLSRRNKYQNPTVKSKSLESSLYEKTLNEAALINRTSIPLYCENRDKILEIKQQQHPKQQQDFNLPIDNMPQSQALLDRLKHFEDAQKRTNIQITMKTNPSLSDLKLPERRNSDREPPKSMRNFYEENRADRSTFDKIKSRRSHLSQENSIPSFELPIKTTTIPIVDQYKIQQQLQKQGEQQKPVNNYNSFINNKHKPLILSSNSALNINNKQQTPPRVIINNTNESNDKNHRSLILNQLDLSENSSTTANSINNIKSPSIEKLEAKILQNKEAINNNNNSLKDDLSLPASLVLKRTAIFEKLKSPEAAYVNSNTNNNSSIIRRSSLNTVLKSASKSPDKIELTKSNLLTTQKTMNDEIHLNRSSVSPAKTTLANKPDLTKENQNDEYSVPSTVQERLKLLTSKNMNINENNSNNGEKIKVERRNLIRFQTQPINSSDSNTNSDSNVHNNSTSNNNFILKNEKEKFENSINKLKLKIENESLNSDLTTNSNSITNTNQPTTTTTHDIKRYNKLKVKTEPLFNLTNLDKAAEEATKLELNAEIMSVKTTTIQERLAALKKSGEEDWKKRKTVYLFDNEFSAFDQAPDQEPSQVTASTAIVEQPVAVGVDQRPKSICEKIKDLQIDAESNWRKRVPENDASKFTVASKIDDKMKTTLQDNIQTFLSPEKIFKRNSKLLSSTSSNSSDKSGNRNNEANENPEENGAAKRERHAPTYQRVIFDRGIEAIKNPADIKPKENFSESKLSKQGSQSSSDNEISKAQRFETVELFSTDSELDTFFKQNNEILIKKAQHTDGSDTFSKAPEDDMDEELDDFDFDQMFTAAQRLTHGNRAKPVRKTKPKGNHLKNISNRIEIKNDYEESSSSKRTSPPTATTTATKTDKTKMNKGLGFTQEALAGLQSTEDFTNIKLKQSDPTTHLNEYPAFNDLMLMQIKGRRYCQTRLVEPLSTSINNGDCYILVSQDVLYLWLGEFSNIIEKARANDIYDWIRSKRDLGLRPNIKSAIIEGKAFAITDMSSNERKFWSLLGGYQQCNEIIASDEDERFESLIIDTNMVYRTLCIENNAYCLEPVKEYWGSVLSYNMLDENEVFVFDFGSEMYIWCGRNAESPRKKHATQLAKQLFDNGYDYTVCDISPIRPQYDCIKNEDGLSESLRQYYKSSSRPSWSIFGKFSQNVETILFKEKFFDWPSESTNPALKKLPLNIALENTLASKAAVSVSRNASQLDTAKNALSLLEPLKGETILNNNAYIENSVNLCLENSNLGRGRHWYDVAERRGFDVITNTVQIWRVVDNRLVECGQSIHGEFYSTDTFVIKWQYKLVAVGFRTLKGELSQHQTNTGRDRQALFFWHGKSSSQNEKGASALLSLDLTGDKTFRSIPHVQVYENKEMPAFCQLFSGTMITFQKRDSSIPWKMFTLRGGEIDEENQLIEVNLSCENLRSRTVLLVLSKAKIFVWYGCYASGLHRNSIKTCAKRLLITHEQTFRFTSATEIEELDEGYENDEFLDVFSKHSGENLKQNRTGLYYSLLKYTNSLVDDFAYTPRLFRMFSLYGKFEAKEVLNPLRSDKMCAYPFYQFQLYDDAQQPCIYLFDNNNEVFIWQGWINDADTTRRDSASEDSGSSDSDSVKLRFNFERKCTLQTAINYWNAKYSDVKEKKFKGYVVYAGLEPIEFINLFPFWEVNENARNFNLNTGKSIGQKDKIEDVLDLLTRDRYPLAILRKRPLPDGVDPTKLEFYLSDQEFEDVLNVSKEEFYTMPYWKQNKFKKQANLY